MLHRPPDTGPHSAMDSVPDRRFTYGGIVFTLSVRVGGPGLFTSKVVCESGLPDADGLELPPDADPYASAAEALRHAEQQAVRWVHDRTGDGQGQF